MNKQISDKVKKELLKNIKCQTCGSFYSSKNVSIKSLGIKEDRAYVLACCDICQTKSQFEAKIVKENLEKKSSSSGDLILSDNIIKDDLTISLEKKSQKNTFSDYLIQENELSDLSKKMQNFSSFKNFFSFVLIFSFFFTGCEFSKIEDVRQSILNGINVVKEANSGAYIKGKDFLEDTKGVIETGPEKIENAKKDLEKIIEDTNNLKNNLKQKAEEVKKTIDQTREAIDSVSNAIDAINAIGGTGENL